MKQCMILDVENNEIHGGILTDNGDVICACCGGLISAEEIGSRSDCTHRILQTFNNWIDFSNEICGDAYMEEQYETYQSN